MNALTCLSCQKKYRTPLFLPATDTPTSIRSYTIGDDVLAQNDDPLGTGMPEYLLYDGHGSTRQLTDATIDGSGDIIDSFSYDGYGVMLGGNPSTPAATNLLYTGEQFDTGLQQYYLRARYYDQNNGRFNRVDPYAGNNQDPQSLHKYTYVHDNPANGIDPSGEMMTCTGQLTVGAIIGNLIAISFPYVMAGLITLTATAIIGIIYELSHEYLAAGLSVIAEVIRSNTRTVAKALQKAAKALKDTVENLLKLKPFFVIKKLMPNIFAFTASCLLLNPSLHRLTWHANPVLTARNRAWVLSRYGHFRTPVNSSIDEYPYASTLEGGMPFAKGCAVPLRENCIQGGYLRAHYYGILRKPYTKFIVVPVPI